MLSRVYLRVSYIAPSLISDGMKESHAKFPTDEELEKQIEAMLAKPKKWWLERAERAIRGDMNHERKTKRASRRD